MISLWYGTRFTIVTVIILETEAFSLILIPCFLLLQLKLEKNGQRDWTEGIAKQNSPTSLSSHIIIIGNFVRSYD